MLGHADAVDHPGPGPAPGQPAVLQPGAATGRGGRNTPVLIRGHAAHDFLDVDTGGRRERRVVGEHGPQQTQLVGRGGLGQPPQPVGSGGPLLQLQAQIRPRRTVPTTDGVPQGGRRGVVALPDHQRRLLPLLLAERTVRVLGRQEQGRQGVDRDHAGRREGTTVAGRGAPPGRQVHHRHRRTTRGATTSSGTVLSRCRSGRPPPHRASRPGPRIAVPSQPPGRSCPLRYRPGGRAVPRSR